MRRLLICCIAALSGCAQAEFCTVAEPLQTDSRELAATIPRLDRAFGDGIVAHNRKGEILCNWTIE